MRTGIALGSNLGDRLGHLLEARAAVLALDTVLPPVLQSPVYETEPVDSDPGAPLFLNAVIEFEFHGQPIALLEQLVAVESRLGRASKRPRNAARTIDLDILYVGNLTLTNPEVVIPHPRLHRRRFVLAPLCDLRPELILPGYHAPIAELLRDLPEHPAVFRREEMW